MYCLLYTSLAGGGGAVYTASKHALAGLTKQIALDYADKNIQVFGLAPGAVKTAMTAADFEPGGLAAVSYTHLDVYKRQQCYQLTIITSD